MTDSGGITDGRLLTDNGPTTDGGPITANGLIGQWTHDGQVQDHGHMPMGYNTYSVCIAVYDNNLNLPPSPQPLHSGAPNFAKFRGVAEGQPRFDKGGGGGCNNGLLFTH